MRTDLGKKRFDCRSSKWLKHFAQKCKFGTIFFSTLDFIWKSHSFQFLVYALPNRFWQVLMKFENPKVKILVFFFPDLCFIWKSHRFQFLGCALPIGFWQLLMNPKWDPHADVIFHQHRLANRCGIVCCHHMIGMVWDGMRAATRWHERWSNVSFCYMKARNDQKRSIKVLEEISPKIALENDMLFLKTDPFADRCWWTILVMLDQATK